MPQRVAHGRLWALASGRGNAHCARVLAFRACPENPLRHAANVICNTTPTRETKPIKDYIFEMIPSELNLILDSSEFEDNGGILITSADWFADDVKLEISVNTGAEENQLWEVSCESSRTCVIRPNWAADIQISDDHPLLWKYKLPSANLYFIGPAKEPEKLFLSLFQLNEELFEGFLSLSEIINRHAKFSDLTRSKSGLLATGPIPLLNKISVLAEQAGFKTSIAGEYPAKKWNGESWLEENGNVKLLRIDQSIIISEAITFQRV